MQRAPQPPSHNLTRPSQICFFAEPNTDGFIGFGVPAAFDTPNHLLGLWRIRGDKRNINNWLSRIEAAFGACPTIGLPGRDGTWLLTQLHIEPNSCARLERCVHPLAAALHRLLTPMLEVPPVPVLAVQWNANRKRWEHDLWTGLPPEQQSMLTDGKSCVPIERQDGALGFATVQDLRRSVSSSVCSLVYDWQVWPASGGAVIRFYALLLADLYRPTVLAHRFHMADPTDVRYLETLVDQPFLYVDVYDRDGELVQQRTLRHRPDLRRRLAVCLDMGADSQSRYTTV